MRIICQIDEGIRDAVVEAEFGTDDRILLLKATKKYGVKREYIITYEITDVKGNVMITEATATVE